jgi:predicted dehydrogenase
MKTRIAVIGLGKMGLMHASLLGMFKNVELVAICEKNSLVRTFGAKTIPDVLITPDILQLRDSRIDAVFITTPPSSHSPIIKSLCENNITKNIFTEKPLAHNYQQAQELCALSKKYLNVNMVGYHRRFAVTFRKAKALLEAEKLGLVQSFSAHALSADFFKAKAAKAAIMRGGVLEDSGCHIIDTLDWLLGDVSVVKASIKSIIGEDSIDEANLTVKTSSNVEGNIEMSWCKEGYRLPSMAITITGVKGKMIANEDFVQLDSLGKTEKWYKHNLDDFAPFSIGGNEYQREDELFLNAIDGKAKALPDFLIASHVEQVIDQANEYIRGTKISA